MPSNLVKIYKGHSFVKTNQKPTTQKIITFDLDETLGSFGHLFLLWQAIEPFIPSFIEQSKVFKELIDIFPEFLRPGILSILEYLHYKKRTGVCSRIFLYTNNQCPPEWVQLILNFFDEKIHGLFDQAVCAFKIGEQRIEPLRTTNSKTYSDLIRCTLLPRNSEICFVDNSYHSKMINERVYYIQPKTYEHGLSADDIINRFMTKFTLFFLPNDYEDSLYKIFVKYRINKSNPDSLLVSQKIMYHLKEYFLLSLKTPKTKKIVWNLGRFTRKKK
jgi:FMN phosphatase YigB (HAD superfamily)